jgi:aspartyl-tRNA(Asn)/glutamyl-tRNA(Gln) amidotransferase subunit C
MDQRPILRAELTRAELDHVAQLARLDLSPDERERYRLLLTSVLAQVVLLDEIDTEQIPPSASVLPLANVMGDDQARPSMAVADVLANAPEHLDDQFRVPPVLEG